MREFRTATKKRGCAFGDAVGQQSKCVESKDDAYPLNISLGQSGAHGIVLAAPRCGGSCGSNNIVVVRAAAFRAAIFFQSSCTVGFGRTCKRTHEEQIVHVEIILASVFVLLTLLGR